jgi:predicted SnoaL-like aldol condensation-catalyzing enzyme
MKKPVLRNYALAAAMALTSHSVLSQSNAGNKELVLKAVSELFIKRDVTAVDRYWDPAYVQHNPRMPNGSAFLKRFIASLRPEASYEPGLVLESGDFVAVHGRYTGFAEKPMVAVDIFKVRDGKLVEHWDVIQEEVPADKSPSGNLMFPAR